MNKLLKQTTHKLFYGKYPYKLVWHSPIAFSFRGGDLISVRKTLDDLQTQLAGSKVAKIPSWYSRFIVVEPKEVHDAQKVFTSLSNIKDFRLRVEGKDVGIFTLDRQWNINLMNSISSVSEWWEPENSLIPNSIIMGPSMEGWEYRITLGRNVPDAFYRWVKNNYSKIKLGPSIKEGIENNNPLYGFYFYVQNQKMLNLVTLVLGSSIRRIDKIVIPDKNA